MEDEAIGFLYCEKFPLSLSILHTFSIDKEHRKKGHGIALLAYALKKFSHEKTRRIFIEPRPFERDWNIHLTISPDKQNKIIQALIHLFWLVT